MNRSKVFTYLALILVFSLWIYSLFQVPTFDLDESLYRRVAEEMKWNGDYWHAVWDERSLHHKPPFFYWLIVIFSRIFDGAEAGVSILSARFPSFLATLGILWSLSRFAPLKETILAWACLLFPLLTSTAVLFDPIQTLLLMPTLLIPHRAFSEGRMILKKEYHWMAISLFGATLFKGLNGLILPTLAIALHTLAFQWKNVFRAGLLYLNHVFLPALALCSLGFWFLDWNIGRPFTQEFFLVHHFGRGTQAMESHGGPWFYHLITTLIGGGLLIPLVAHHWLRTRPSLRRLGYPLTFAVAIIVFFSLSATKLPHYTWPIWPALVLFYLEIRKLPTVTMGVKWVEAWKFLLIPTLALGIALFWLVLNPEAIPQTELTDIEVLLLSAAATFCSVVPFVFQRFLKQPEYLAFFNAMITLLIAVPASSIAERIWVEPYREAVRELKKQNPQPGVCLWDTGPMTATLSLVMGQELGRGYTHNRCEPTGMRFLISPKARDEECAERKMSVLHRGKTLTLCGYIVN